QRYDFGVAPDFLVEAPQIGFQIKRAEEALGLSDRPPHFEVVLSEVGAGRRRLGGKRAFRSVRGILREQAPIVIVKRGRDDMRVRAQSAEGFEGVTMNLEGEGRGAVVGG